MNHNGFVLPLRLEPLFHRDDETILSPQIQPRYLARQIGLGWYRQMEEIHEFVPAGTRLLIRRDIRNNIVSEYISTRVTRHTFYGNWTHQTVVYRSNEVSPYPFDMDCFTQRDDIMANFNNNNPFHQAAQAMQALAFVLPPPQLPLQRQNAMPLIPLMPLVNPRAEGQPMWVDEEDNPLIFPMDPIVVEGRPHLSSADLFSFNQ